MGEVKVLLGDGSGEVTDLGGANGRGERVGEALRADEEVRRAPRAEFEQYNREYCNNSPVDMKTKRLL